MSMRERRVVRCAIYTRKSSEEGLEQPFNSLDAQREACQTYILSQRQEGWRAIDAHYDDGGYSGGSMERPGLKRLLVDIEAKKVDTVVVYKVDRLTRSLADFAKMVEAFDARGVSFVSVTQQFNTTSSMGRLTLNVLLSFAQFEREVTGERIRDKIAASKRKGMWMGGCIPLGYDLKDRHLIVNDGEAEQVRQIYRQYLEFSCVKRLKARLDSDGTKSKLRVSRSGNSSGGSSYSRGALYKILSNKTYLGEIPHKGQSYPGEHEAIVDRELWEKVRKRMSESIRGERHGRNAAAPSLLRGLVFDKSGRRLTPSHAVKRGRRYRYYVSQLVIEDARSPSDTAARIPAQELETVVLAKLKAFFASADEITSALCDPSDDIAGTRQLVEASNCSAKSLDSNPHEEVSQFIAEVVDRIVVHKASVAIQINREALRARLFHPDRAPAKESAQQSRTGELLVLDVPVKFRRCRGEMRLIIPSSNEASERRKPIPSLVKAIARAQDWVRAIVAGEYSDQRAIAKAMGINEQYVSHVIAGAFLAPNIVEAIAGGHTRPELTVSELLQNSSLSWKEQRARLAEFPALSNPS